MKLLKPIVMKTITIASQMPIQVRIDERNVIESQYSIMNAIE